MTHRLPDSDHDGRQRVAKMMQMLGNIAPEGIERLTLIEDCYGAGVMNVTVYLVPVADVYRHDPAGYAEVRQEILDCDTPGTWLEPAPPGAA